MRLFGLLAILLVILCFTAYLPFIVIAMVVGLGLCVGGLLLGTGLHSAWKKISGRA